MVDRRRKIWSTGMIFVLSILRLTDVAGQKADYGTVPLRHRIDLYRNLTLLRPDFDERKARKFGRLIARGRTERVRELVELGADVNVVGREGITPLYIALFSLNYEAFELLINAGADIYHQTEDWGDFDLFDMAARLGDGRYIGALLRQARKLSDHDTAFYREIVFDAMRSRVATFETMRVVLDNIPQMSLIGSPYGHPAINAVTVREYRKTILLIDYDPSLFNDNELRSTFIQRLQETRQFDDEFFRARAELVEHLENEHGIEVQLQYPEPRER